MSADNCSSDCALPPCLHQSAGMMVDVRPWPKAFRPPPPPEQQQTEQQQTDGSDPPEQAQQAQQPRCFYFMGLSKKKVCERAGARQAARIARSCAGDSQPVRHGATARGSCLLPGTSPNLHLSPGCRALASNAHCRRKRTMPLAARSSSPSLRSISPHPSTSLRTRQAVLHSLFCFWPRLCLHCAVAQVGKWDG